MTLEELQAMTDAELNRLSAVKVMEWTYDEGRCEYLGADGRHIRDDAEFWNHPDTWNPTGDMNDAMELLNQFNEVDLSKGFRSEEENEYEYKLTNEIMYSCKIGFGRKWISADSLSRAITIASILVK